MIREEGQDAAAVCEVSFELDDVCVLGTRVSADALVRGDVEWDFDVNVPTVGEVMLQIVREQRHRRHNLITATHNEVDDSDGRSGQHRAGSSLKPAVQLEETLQGRFTSLSRQVLSIETL